MRLNSKLEAEGAEFLVLGLLLVEGIVAHKTYTRAPNYDLVAVNPEHNTSARIQVKSRWATDFDGGFLIKNFETDFVVFVALNRGNRYSRAHIPDGKRDPDFYVFPVDVVRSALYAKSSWGKSFLKAVPNLDEYRGNWGLIRSFLEEPKEA